jgi:hypothetical protein
MNHSIRGRSESCCLCITSDNAQAIAQSITAMAGSGKPGHLFDANELREIISVVPLIVVVVRV